MSGRYIAALKVVSHGKLNGKRCDYYTVDVKIIKSLCALLEDSVVSTVQVIGKWSLLIRSDRSAYITQTRQFFKKSAFLRSTEYS